MQKCQICLHPNCKDIDRQIVTGANLTKLARDYDLSYDSMYRHSKLHVSRQMAKAGEIKAQNHGLDVLNELQTLMERTQEILDVAQKKKQNALALSAIRELRGHLTLISQIQAFLIKEGNRGAGLTDEEIHQKEREDEMAEITKHNWEGLAEEEKGAYNNVCLKLMGSIKERVRYVNYYDGVNEEIFDWSTIDFSDAMVNPRKGTTEEEKVQETASTTPENDDDDMPMGVKEIQGTPIPWTPRQMKGVTSRRR